MGRENHTQFGGNQHLQEAINTARGAIEAAGALLQELPHPRDRVPTSILKGAVAMIETVVLEGRNRRSGPSIQQQTEVQP